MSFPRRNAHAGRLVAATVDAASAVAGAVRGARAPPAGRPSDGVDANEQRGAIPVDDAGIHDAVTGVDVARRVAAAVGRSRTQRAADRLERSIAWA